MATRKPLPTVRGKDVLKILSLISDSITALEAVIEAMGGKNAVLIKGTAPDRMGKREEAGIFIIPTRILAPVCKPDTPHRKVILGRPPTRVGGVGRRRGVGR